MAEIAICRENSYYDSVTLMTLSSKLKKMPGVHDAVVSMATPMNKELLENIGMLKGDLADAGPNDMLIAIKGESDEVCQEVLKSIDALMQDKAGKGEDDGHRQYKTMAEADEAAGPFDVAVISVAGHFAAREARNALKRGMHVMLFSDNVSVEDELALKQLAHEKGLLLMGPDCGTAILDGVGLCFSNRMRKGSIGLVGASGTGLQELCVLIDRLGGGITQAIGTGGRDLLADIGGIMVLDGIELLDADEDTRVIAIVSKPPTAAIADKVIARARKCSKPVVICFIANGTTYADGNIVFASSLEDAAFKAIALSEGKSLPEDCGTGTVTRFAIDEQAMQEAASHFDGAQRYLRGLFCGGTLAAEALYEASKVLGCIKSNVAKKTEQKIDDPMKSEANCIIDMGDDLFTEGRPHPMISPDLRCERIIQEAADPECAVILLDFEIGYGSNANPAAIAIEAIEEGRKARAASSDACGEVAFVGYVQGTEGDSQGIREQRRMLEEAGVLVADSNLQAVSMALEIMKRNGGEQHV